MREHFEWFETVLHVTIGVYFQQQGQKYLSPLCPYESSPSTILPCSRWLL